MNRASYSVETKDKVVEMKQNRYSRKEIMDKLI